MAVCDLDENAPWSMDYDVIICFAVLPYLKYPLTILEWIRERSKVGLIECQYDGDGPGTEMRFPLGINFPSTITDDRMMKYYLSQIGWQSVEAIGKTWVEDRNMYRTIWRCE